MSDHADSPWPRASRVIACHPARATAVAAPCHECRVCPPPCRKRTGGAAGGAPPAPAGGRRGPPPPPPPPPRGCPPPPRRSRGAAPAATGAEPCQGRDTVIT